MKTLIIYKSKTGFVKKYADWIGAELSADVFEVSKVNLDMLTDYDTLIYGGSLHAVGINGVKFITRSFEQLMGKNLIVFASGASPSNEKVIEEVFTRNFTSEQQKQVKFFYLRGGFNYDKLPPFDKVLMTLMKWTLMLKKSMKKELVADEIGLLEAYDKPVDFTRKSNIAEIVAYVKSQA